MDRPTFIATHKVDYDAVCQLIGQDLQLDNFDIFTHFDTLKSESDILNFINVLRNRGRFACVITNPDDKIVAKRIIELAYFVGQSLGPYVSTFVIQKCGLDIAKHILSQVK
jgi:hypothetical protein